MDVTPDASHGARDRRQKVEWRAAAENMLRQYGWQLADYGGEPAEPSTPVLVDWEPPRSAPPGYSVHLVMAAPGDGCTWAVVWPCGVCVGCCVSVLREHVEGIMRGADPSSTSCTIV